MYWLCLASLVVFSSTINQGGNIYVGWVIFWGWPGHACSLMKLKKMPYAIYMQLEQHSNSYHKVLQQDLPDKFFKNVLLKEI